MLEQVISMSESMFGLLLSAAIYISIGILVVGVLLIALYFAVLFSLEALEPIITGVATLVTLICLCIGKLLEFIFSTQRNKIPLFALFIGCFIALIGTISSMELGIIYGLGVTLIALSSIAIRVQENREFKNLEHGLTMYQSMKRKSGLINLGIGAIYCLAAVAITGTVAISIYTIPGLALIGFGAGKMMKHSFIKRSSLRLLSFAIKIKYFYKDTTGLIAKAMNFKMSQRTQRIMA